MNDKVSVIIPFYSNKEWLIEALNSVKNQTYKNYEIIIVDDGSHEDLTGLTDDALLISLNENKGVSNARNIGMENTSGNFIAFLDSDDIWTSDKLEKQIKYMQNNQYKWSHTSYQYFDHSNKIVDTSELINNIFPRCIFSTNMATPTVMICKEIIEENNYFFNPHIREGEDTIMWAEIARKYPVGQLNIVLTKIRDRNANTSKDIQRQLLAKSHFYEYLLNINHKNIFDLFFMKYSGFLSYIHFDSIAKMLYLPAYIYFKIRKLYLMKRGG